MNVLIVDMGSRLNKFGGEERMASLLQKRLKGSFTTFYLGYETHYTGNGKDHIILGRGKRINENIRRNILSELSPFRVAYYLFYVRNLFGIGMGRGILLERIRRINPEVIISNSIQDFPIINYLRGKGLDFKTMYIDHGSISTGNTAGYFSKEGIPMTFGTGINAASFEKARAEFFRFFNMNIAINLMQFEAISRYTKKVAYIPNGLDIKARREPSMERQLRSRFGIKEGDFVVLYVGRLFDRQKNVSTLIRSFTLIDDPRMKLVVAGEGPSFSEYKALAGDDGRIIFTGRLEEKRLNSIYNLADLFVLPSVWEGFNLTVLEAAAHSIPIVLSKNAYSQDLRKASGDHIETFDTFKHEELARLLDRVRKNKGMRERLRKASHEINAFFTEEKMLKRYEKEIRGLAAGKR